MENKDKLTRQVNKIVQLHLDRALAYQQARSLSTDLTLKRRFEECMQQSYFFADKLQVSMDLKELATRGRPSLQGVFCRGWMTFRAFLSNRKDIVLLQSCLAREKKIHLSYECLCTNKYLDFNYPLLKYTFLQQQFSLKKMWEDLDALVELLQPTSSDLMEAKPSYSTINSLSQNSSIS